MCLLVWNEFSRDASWVVWKFINRLNFCGYYSTRCCSQYVDSSCDPRVQTKLLIGAMQFLITLNHLQQISFNLAKKIRCEHKI